MAESHVKVKCFICEEWKYVYEFDTFIYDMVNPEDAICKNCKETKEKGE